MSSDCNDPRMISSVVATQAYKLDLISVADIRLILSVRSDMETTARPRNRMGLRLAIVLLLAALILALFGTIDRGGPFRPWHRLFGPKEDGDWAALSIDGRKVSPLNYRVAVFDRKVVGGADGCNDWAYSSEPDANGERTVESTMAFCPEQEQGQALRILAYASNVKLLPDGKLQLTGRGHSAVFVRCRWKTVKEGGRDWSSEVTRCLVD